MSVEVARSNQQRYGSYPVAMTFTSNDDTNDLSEVTQPAYSAAFDSNDGTKRHAACDECRKRKLKCSGEPDGCTRCQKQKLLCHYSEQKQMGRPRKRQKTESEITAAQQSVTSPPRPIQPAPEPQHEQYFNSVPLDPGLAILENEQTQFESICTAPIARAVRNEVISTNSEQILPGLMSSNSDSNHSQNQLPTPEQFDSFEATYPTDIAHWPDFSTLEMLPLPVEDKYQIGVVSPSDPDVNPEALSNLPAIPACPCLPNLYLTLSTLSTLSSFPFNQQTIHTIEAAYRTAKGVIYCSVCPQKFDTGSSNLMLGCTLLNVLADQWSRFRRLGTEDLRKAFGTPDQQQMRISTKTGQMWRTFALETMRAYVHGDRSAPLPPNSPAAYTSPESDGGSLDAIGSPPPISLVGLCDALCRRQRQWHDLDELTDEFPDRVTPDLVIGHLVGHSHDTPGKFLCLEIVNHAKLMVENLMTPIHR